MKKYIFTAFIALQVLLTGCTHKQAQGIKTNLTATEFSEKIKELPDAIILDVRTPEEFSTGHLANALNYDADGDAFEKQLATLDKSKPVLVYCLSGGRSAWAAEKMRSEGFQPVYEMDGGLMKWRHANLPEITGQQAISDGMSKQQFEALINSDKAVLVDFYADWCAPCKRMSPYLEEISKEMADRVTVIRINTEQHPALCRELNIDAIPVLHLYKNKTLAWSNTGYIEKEKVVAQLQ